MTNYIGIDIGGTNTKVALVNQKGEISLLRRVYYKEFELALDEFLDQVLTIVNDVIDTGVEPFESIGISCPGLQMENGRGVLYSINMPILNKFDLKNFFESTLKLPVAILNDLVAHSLAESSFGVGKGVERFLNVSLGTGVGHTFIYKGKPQLSINGISGDSGRMVIDPDSDLKDSGGITGSAEALCGVKAIEILGKKFFNKEYAAQEIIKMAREQNNPDAVEIMSMVSHKLALLLIDLSAIYFPELISLTGGQTEAGQFFIDECQKEFDERGSVYFDGIMNFLGKDRDIRILKAEAGGLAGVIGSIVPFLF
jgi:glucokinase